MSVSIIGGINIDFKGSSYQKLSLKTSNPGRIFYSSGGVSRNVAHNLCKLEVPVNLFGVVGNDVFGEIILAELNTLKINTNFIKISDNYRTGVYLAILDQKKDMLVSISDMEIIKEINVNYIEKHKDTLLHSKIVFLEANLEPQVIEYTLKILENTDVCTVFNAVSNQKVKKLKNIIGKIDYLTLNFSELKSLIEQENLNFSDYKSIQKIFSEEFPNIFNLIITNGEEGVLFFNNQLKKTEFFSVEKVKDSEIIDANGAGDAFTSGFIYGIYNDADIEKSIEYGIKAARITLKSPKTVADELSCKIFGVRSGARDRRSLP
ncbi:ribokinase [Petrotoga mexicana DSM 14811]|uniref:Ribokinase n=1 Tax=Petrotoga mexicana DSM 14811 TaxID=1122954 RepID=A0A2K1P7H7_9BACT|nr:carbohydrate kinase family protein [Petrotoga mexicana]PNR98741.1 ribokinase [Petrotoga mexicana DSM 14811]